MTQADIVLKHIKMNGSISSYEAIMDHGITRLAARIHDLKQRGLEFITVTRKNKATGKRYARYVLKNEEAA